MSLLQSLQTDCRARLQAQTFFGSQPQIPVYIEIQKDVQSQLNGTLARLGVGVIMLSARLSNRSPAPGMYPKWDRAAIVARVIENVIINRAASGTGQPADLIAECVAYYLHSWAPDCTGNKLMCDSVELVDDPRVLIYDVHVFTGGVTQSAPVRI